MAVVGDVFGLNAVYDFQVENVNNNNLNSWPENLPGNPSNFLGPYLRSYVAGGRNPGITSNVERLDLSSDTFSVAGTLLAPNYAFATCSNNSYGYSGGGRFSTFNKFDFSNETSSSPTPGNTLPTDLSNPASVENSSYGYFAGGQNFPPTTNFVNTISRFDFSNETVSNPGNNLLTKRKSSTGVSSSSHGYFTGGFLPPSISTISKLDFTNDSINDLSTFLSPGPRYGHAGTQSSLNGYVCGGVPFLNLTNIARIDFSNDSVSTIPTPHPQSRNGSTKSDTNGYFLGGPPSRGNSVVIKLDFSTDSAARTTDLPIPYWIEMVGFQRQIFSPVNSPGAGVVAKGVRFSNANHVKTAGYTTTYSPLPALSLLKYNISSDTWSQVPNITPGTGIYRGFAINNNDYAYVAGQTDAKLFKFQFTTETNIGSVAYPNPPNTYVRGVSTREYGFMHNGASMGRLEFSTDTTTDYPNALPLGRNAQGTMYNPSYGYFAGGRSPDISNVQRWDFSTYVGTTLPNASNAPYGTSLFLVGNTNSNDAGYYFGGYNRCQVRRLDFSTEQNTGLTNMPATSREGYCFSGQYDGYFGGGYATGIPSLKIDYSTESYSSTTASPVNIYISHPFSNGL